MPKKKSHGLTGKPSNRGNYNLTERLHQKVRAGVTDKLKASAKAANKPIGVHLSDLIEADINRSKEK